MNFFFWARPCKQALPASTPAQAERRKVWGCMMHLPGRYERVGRLGYLWRSIERDNKVVLQS